MATVDDPIALSGAQVTAVVHGSAALDVSQVGIASLRFGVGQVTALSTTIVPGSEPYPDLVASFPMAGSGVALGDTEACVSGLVGGGGLRSQGRKPPRQPLVAIEVEVAA